jgi:hypothetical protein
VGVTALEQNSCFVAMGSSRDSQASYRHSHRDPGRARGLPLPGVRVRLLPDRDAVAVNDQVAQVSAWSSWMDAITPGKNSKPTSSAICISRGNQSKVL